jgi:uncharacterized protein
MRYVARELTHVLMGAARHFPAVVVTGPRRAGKTTLLRQLFREAQYVLLEDPDIQGRVRSDPRSFIEGLHPPVIFDEIQNTPELLNYVRTLIDQRPRRMGQWLFTGSQEAPLMRGITESMAGRAAILQLLPFSLLETERVTLLHGGFPEVVARPKSRDLVTFRRFLALLASRHGQVLNKTDLAAPLGISVPTIGEWLQILEATGEIILVPPYFENFGKRLIKSPKLYWLDSGLACYLLGIKSVAELERSPFLGPLFEGFVAAEILKSQTNRGMRRELYYFRDQQGLEVDFLVPGPNLGLWLVEAKAGKTVQHGMAAPLQSLQRSLGKKTSRLIVVHRRPRTSMITSAIGRGVEAFPLEHFIEELAQGAKQTQQKSKRYSC